MVGTRADEEILIQGVPRLVVLGYRAQKSE